MVLRPLTKCCVLAARGMLMGAPAQANSTELTAPSVYLGHNTRMYAFVGMYQCEVMPIYFQLLFQYLLFFVNVVILASSCKII